MTSDDNDNFSAIKYSGYTDRERHTGDSGNVVIEETSIGKDCVVGQCLDTRPGGEGRACRPCQLHPADEGVLVGGPTRFLMVYEHTIVKQVSK